MLLRSGLRTNIPSVSQPAMGSLQARETAIALAAWRQDYEEIDLSKHIIRQWTLPNDERDPVEIIDMLPDNQKPQLPEGHIWSHSQNGLTILAHKDVPESDFEIYLFGPDGKNRFDYIVVEGDCPIHSFAMTKIEGFPKGLRDKYPDGVTLASYKKDGEVYARGHSLDYQDTKGHPSETDTISTLFRYNFKPEPWGEDGKNSLWSRTIRKIVVERLRKIEGSYSEVVLYGNTPEITDGNVPIPEAVLFETTTLQADRLACLFVPYNHSCHQGGGRGSADRWIKELLVPDTYPALVYDETRKMISVKRTDHPLPSDPRLMDVKDAYNLARHAEVEFDGADMKLQFVVYGKTHNASDERLIFWLARAVRVALQIDRSCRSLLPSFPPHIMNTIMGVFKPNYLAHLPEIARSISQLHEVASRFMDKASRLDIRLTMPDPSASSTAGSSYKEEKKDREPAVASCSFTFTGGGLFSSASTPPKKTSTSNPNNTTIEQTPEPSSSRNAEKRVFTIAKSPIEELGSSLLRDKSRLALLFAEDKGVEKKPVPSSSRNAEKRVSTTAKSPIEELGSSLLREKSRLALLFAEDKEVEKKSEPSSSKKEQVGNFDGFSFSILPISKKIICLGVDPNNPDKLEILVAEINQSMGEKSLLILAGVTSNMARLLFPKIAERFKEVEVELKKSPITRIIVCRARYLKTTKKYASLYFNGKVEVDPPTS